MVLTVPIFFPAIAFRMRAEFEADTTLLLTVRPSSWRSPIWYSPVDLVRCEADKLATDQVSVGRTQEILRSGP